jgi:hypothetical protein
MTKKQAVKKLKDTGMITTAMLKPLGMNFEQFLRYAQLPSDTSALFVVELIKHLELSQEEYRRQLETWRELNAAQLTNR